MNIRGPYYRLSSMDDNKDHKTTEHRKMPPGELEHCMKTFTPQVMVCPPQKRQDGQQAAVCAIVLESPTLLALSTQVADWMNAHPNYHLLTFSHALETRLEPGASLAGPRRYAVYTGVLLVGPPSRTEGHEQSDLLSQDEMLLARW
jgi:hypothetical protein